jgi:acetyl/propionyl-CoA carboxylase alpha subunit/acetyl-CoA carboxylase carboxyltransferase component
VPPPDRLLVSNRGEIALRIQCTAGELGIHAVAVYSEDDADSLHVRRAPEAVALRGRGAAAYLDQEQMVEVAAATRCMAIHPGYGFLSESAAFARRCAEAGVTFIGPSAEVLELCGDKVRARALASTAGVPLLEGSSTPVDVAAAAWFLHDLPAGEAMVIKAVAGGGGRGLRVVHDPGAVEAAFARCRAEALAAFGHDELYVERLLPHARHVEVQALGDSAGAVAHLGERDCTIQRRYQKLVETTPAPGLPQRLRDRICDAALRLAEAAGLDNAATFEFLVAAAADGRVTERSAFFFLEANPRLQVEHTVTEEAYGVDLVQIQLELAAGKTLAELGLDGATARPPRGCALQVRVNLETIDRDGGAVPSAGTLTVFETPSGPGLRVDHCGYAGYQVSPSFDSLLAKIVAHTPSGELPAAAVKARRALRDLRVEGAATNASFLLRLLDHPDFVAGRWTTRFVEDHLEELVRDEAHEATSSVAAIPPATPSPQQRAGARIDASDPLAVLVYGKSAGAPPPSATQRSATNPTQSPLPARPGAASDPPAGVIVVAAPLQGTVVTVEVESDALVQQGQTVLVMEAMKMQHEVCAPESGIVRQILVAPGDPVWAGASLAWLEPSGEGVAHVAITADIDLDQPRADLAEVLARRARGLDSARPDSVAKRHARGQRTARENVEDLCDPGSFVEYGPLVLAAQRQRRTVEDLIERTPADGMVCGVGNVNGAMFAGRPQAPTRCAVLAYDYTVLAGTQGRQNHRKTDRVLELAARHRLPVVLFAEGGGGRPGDTDDAATSGDVRTFASFARLSALVPVVGIATGRCFAGNASLLGCCDVVIATAGSNIGMGGPAMIEGGGLGVFRPEEIGPMSVQVPNGVVDLAVRDEAEAVAVAKRYLSYFQGPLGEWTCADQRRLRAAIPENRLRVYDVRAVIDTLADEGSVLELRPAFGLGMVTALARVEGRPLGLVANNPTHLAGAIDSDGADKASRFLQLCDAFDLPVLFLCDTPGIMVGPEVEKTALVRHANRMFLAGANLAVPCATIVLRKAYGLGAIAMAAGTFKAPSFTVSWPTGEFGGMGLEGYVKLGYRKELEAIADPVERRRAYEEMVAAAYQRGKALEQATFFGVDDVIDPAVSRRWISNVLFAPVAAAPDQPRKRRPFIDSW